MTEIEMKLLLTRYNKLSKERAEAAYMWGHGGESVCYESKWSKCIDEMSKMMGDLRKDGYKFIFTNFKRVGKFQYQVYDIVPANNCDSVSST